LRVLFLLLEEERIYFSCEKEIFFELVSIKLLFLFGFLLAFLGSVRKAANSLSVSRFFFLVSYSLSYCKIRFLSSGKL
jgi:hypothetical protein